MDEYWYWVDAGKPKKRRKDPTEGPWSTQDTACCLSCFLVWPHDDVEDRFWHPGQEHRRGCAHGPGIVGPDDWRPSRLATAMRRHEENK